MATDKDFMTFWRWFTKGSGGKAGFKRLINLWMLFHVGVGWGLSRLVPLELASAANAVLLPLGGILIGLAFAWAGNAKSLMQSTEIDELAEYHEGGFVDYVYTYQLAILVILMTIVLWALAGLEVYDKVWPKVSGGNHYFVVQTILYSMSSLTLRECWHVVLGAQFMLLAQRRIKRTKPKENQ